MTQKLYYSRSATLPLLLLLVCVAHSSYSPSENIKLHKQVETAQNAANAIQKRSLTDLNPLRGEQHAFDLQLDFAKSPRSLRIAPSADQLDNPDESIFNSFLEMRTSSRHISPSELKQALKPIFKEAFDSNKKIPEKTKVLLENSAEIEEGVKSILVGEISDEITSSTLVNAAGFKKLVQYQDRTFRDDVKLISDLLISRPQSPTIPNILGLLGPGAVLEGHLKALLLEHFPDDTPSITQVIKNIKNLHTETVQYVTLVRSFKSTYPHREIPQTIADDTIAKMRICVVQALAPFGGVQFEFSHFFYKFIHSNTVVEFGRSLKAAKTRAAFEARLIEPWGFGHMYFAKPLRDEPFEDTDINVINDLAQLNSHSLLALENTKIRVEFTSEAEAIKNKLSKYLYPEEIMDLAQLLSANQVTLKFIFYSVINNIQWRKFIMNGFNVGLHYLLR